MESAVRLVQMAFFMIYQSEWRVLPTYMIDRITTMGGAVNLMRERHECSSILWCIHL